MKKIFVLLFMLLWLGAGCTSDELVETAVPDREVTLAPVDNQSEVESTRPPAERFQVDEMVTIEVEKGMPVSETPTPGEDDMTEPTVPGVPGSQSETVQVVKADLSDRLSVSIDEIELVSFAEVTWRDGSLGCPEPGVNYIQVLTPGQQIILQVNGQEYHYHSGRNSDFRYCPNPEPPLSEPGSEIPNQPPPPGVDD